MSDTILPTGESVQTAKALAKSAVKQGETKGAGKLEQACKDFESLFVSQMMQQMRKTVPQDGLLNGGRAEKIYTEMLDSEMAKSISNQRGIGLAAMMYRQLSAIAAEENSGEPK